MNMTKNVAHDGFEPVGSPAGRGTGAAGTANASQRVAYYRFKPWNIGRFLIWSLFAVVLIISPLVFKSSLALTMLSQMGYLIIICLSYNILLGQGGMLSFGHAVYVGLGSFLAIHAMNMGAKGGLQIPLVAIPLVGGLAGMFFAILLGFVTTKKSGTTFAMITMGIGELVASMALMFPSFFGGEGGITTDRVYGPTRSACATSRSSLPASSRASAAGWRRSTSRS
jgi:branched-chain amino acid transport system permease protein